MTSFSIKTARATEQLLGRIPYYGRAVLLPRSLGRQGTDEAHFIYNGTNYLGTFSANYTSNPLISRTYSANFNGGSGNTSYSFTADPSGTPSIVIIGSYFNAASPPTAVTYGGESMTPVTPYVSNPGDGGSGAWAYYLVDPPTGSQTVDITKASTDNINAEVVTYTGTNISSPIGAVATSSTSSSPNTLSLTTASNSWIVATINGNTISSVTNNSADMGDVTAGYKSYYDTNGTTGATSNSVVTTFSGEAGLAALVFELKAQ